MFILTETTEGLQSPMCFVLLLKCAHSCPKCHEFFFLCSLLSFCMFFLFCYSFVCFVVTLSHGNYLIMGNCGTSATTPFVLTLQAKARVKRRRFRRGPAANVKVLFKIYIDYSFDYLIYVIHIYDIYIYIYIYMYIYIYTFTTMCVCIHIYIYIYLSIYLAIYTSLSIYISLYI